MSIPCAQRNCYVYLRNYALSERTRPPARRFSFHACRIVLEQLVSALLPFKITDSTAEIINSMHSLSFALMALLAVFAPVLEEIIFRGFVYGSLRTALHKSLPDLSATNYARRRLCFDLLAAFVSALIFGLAHMNLAGLPLYVVSGMVFAEAYRRSGSLYVPMIGHSINNGILMVLMMLVH